MDDPRNHGVEQPGGVRWGFGLKLHKLNEIKSKAEPAILNIKIIVWEMEVGRTKKPQKAVAL